MQHKKRKDPLLDEELEEYRGLLETPDHYEEGFTLKTIVGVLFVSFIMVPGNIYLGLMIGGGMGAAAQWVTIILFAELAKRSFTTLRRQETYLLYYVAASLIASGTGSFQGLLWNQYLVQSPAAKQFGISQLIPAWIAPQPDSPAIINRTFLHPDWLPALGLLVAGMIIGRVAWFTMGYSLFRLMSDVEKLPFPLAPIAAQGATALAESTTGEETWRWKVFSAGAMIGLVFGAVYVGIPAITGAMLAEPIQLIPIPFIDFTHITGNFLPATPVGFTAHLGAVLTGTVLPFWGVVGAFGGVVLHTIASPILYRYGFFPHWHQGMEAIQTRFVCSVDLWLSYSLGLTAAVALIGVYQVVAGLRRRAREQDATQRWRDAKPPEGRGDFPLWLMLALFACTVAGLIFIAYLMLPQFFAFFGFFLFFGFVFTPLMSFVSARLYGTVGMTVDVPYVREAMILLSGYQGVTIWFVPFPEANYGQQAQQFREIELTGTRFTSVLKAEVFMVPVVLLTSFLYWSYIWKLAPIPSAAYPYAQKMWRLQAYELCLWYTGTFRGQSQQEGEKRIWTPPNLMDQQWWFWRVRAVDGRGAESDWSEVRAVYTNLEGKKVLKERPKLVPVHEEQARQLAANRPPVPPMVLGPADGQQLTGPSGATPQFMVRQTTDPDGDPIQEYYFEVDTDPAFSSPWKQTSRDRPWLFEALKAKVAAVGFAVGVVGYALLAALGLPILVVFGYVRSLTVLPHLIVPEIIGAMLARKYFWKKYGRRQWRIYAPVLTVGFGCGMALMGMAAIAVALIQKSVSVLIF